MIFFGSYEAENDGRAFPSKSQTSPHITFDRLKVGGGRIVQVRQTLSAKSSSKHSQSSPPNLASVRELYT